MRHITINDLAKRLKLSASTVSRALRDHPDISKKTKARVRDVAAKTNYQPNLIAQSLQTRRSNNIGVIVPEIRNTFFSTVISGIEEVAYEAGYTIMVCQSNDTYIRETINTRALAANRVAGMLVSISQETHDFEHLRTIMTQGIPLVLFDRIVEDLEVSKVVVDDFNGAYNAVSYLIRQGRKRIAHIGGRNQLYVSRKRRQGFEAAMKDHNISPNPDYIVTGGYHEEDGRAAAQELCGLAAPPDAVFAINDPVALGAYMHFTDSGIKIPEEIALIGFSNNPNTTLIRPRLTTVSQPAFEMGKVAVSLLLKKLGSSSIASSAETVVLKTELLIRESA
jgi:LacI family repressor for deo operon, udp, cdd, tsx, nupC, and nupG